MTRYFPKYRILSYALGCGVPIAVVLVWWFGFGGTIGFGSPLGMVMLAILIFAPMLSFNYFNRRAERELERILALYNVECDPFAFAEEGAQIADKATVPYSAFDTWFLSFYALALLDVGRTEEAAEIGRNMQEFAENAVDDEEKASYLVNILPLVLRLFGPEAGMNVVATALGIVRANPTPNGAEQENYLVSQQEMIRAVQDNDSDYLLHRCETIRKDEAGIQQMRVRVLEAEKEAKIREQLGDGEGAAECWRFVAENGNRLPCAEEARKHL